MGCCLSFQNEKSKIEVIDKTPDGFDYLKPVGRIYYSNNEVYDVLKVEIAFDGWYMNSVRLWPKNKKIRHHFLLLQRTLSFSLQVLSKSSCDDAVF